MLPVILALFPLVLGKLEVNLNILPINCLFGCFDALTLVKFGDIPETAGYYDGYCNSTIFTTTLVASLDKYCTTEQIDAGWEKVTEYCLEYGLGSVLAPLDSVRAQIPAQLEEVNTVTVAGETMNSTFVLAQEAFNDGERTENAWNREMNFVSECGFDY